MEEAQNFVSCIVFLENDINFQIEDFMTSLWRHGRHFTKAL